jgi:hypothetical protein
MIGAKGKTYEVANFFEKKKDTAATQRKKAS